MMKLTAKIPFNRPFFNHRAFELLTTFTENGSSLLTREFTALCVQRLQQLHNCAKVYLTKSCTQALELSSLLVSIENGDEVILPSFGYVSCATSFLLRGARCRFVDIDPSTMNISAIAAANAISNRTRAILAINYGGISCDYDALRKLVSSANIPLIEDNAMGIGASYKDKALGTLGDISTVSFDYLKNITCGEGGAIILNNPIFEESIKTIYENGTNKIDFINGKVDKYEWKSLGSNYYLSEVLSAVLYQQLVFIEELTANRKKSWNYYNRAFNDLQKKGEMELLEIPTYSEHNGHLFVIKLADEKVRGRIMHYLREREIESAFHYTPLHKSEFGIKSGIFIGEDKHTTRDSLRMLRLPLYNNIATDEQDRVINAIFSFFA